MRSTITRILIIGMLIVMGCATSEYPSHTPDTHFPATTTPEETETHFCTDPRPEICTREYNPVCGHLLGGGTKTYSNACTACADIEVVSYVPGECP